LVFAFIDEPARMTGTVVKFRCIISDPKDMTFTWFVYSNEVVAGPFETEQVRIMLKTGQIPPGSFIWWKGQREWIPVTMWEAQLTQIVKTTTERAQNPVWYIDLGSSGASPIGPLTQNELIENLKGVANLSHIRLWAVGMAKWSSLFELSDVMDLLGVSRRENARAPLMGAVAVTRSNDDPRGFVLKAASISVAGMGVLGGHDLRKGDDVSLLIKSAEFPPGGIHLRGSVAYVTSNGYAGIRFHKVHPESQSIIFDYVKRFNQDMAASDAA